MKKLVLWMIALACLLPGGALFAQSIAGTWQGALTPVPGRELRIVIKISTTDADTLKATLYSIDQGGAPINASAFSLQGSAVKMTVARIGGSYEGRLSGDGNSITGTWTQGPPMPLNLKRATNETAWTIPTPPPPPKRMAADAKPSFEVATIKPSKPGTPGHSFLVRGSEFTTTNTTLSDLLTFAYGLHPRQITEAPAWMESDKYDLLAKPDIEGQPSAEQLKSMVQKLLAERYQLKFHHDKKELSVYALVLGKTGSKLNKSEGDPTGLPGLFFRGLGALTVRNATMMDFTGLMQASVLDRPVVDQTGLAGRWDFSLNWTPDETQFGGRAGQVPQPPANGADVPPDLYTAIQQQLGLKLEPTKAPVEVLVIDHVEKPSEN